MISQSKSRIFLSFILILSALVFLSGCGKGKAVPTKEEIKTALENYIKTFGNIQLQNNPKTMLLKAKVAGLDNFQILEMYDHSYDFSQLADKIDGPVDIKSLNVTKDLYKGAQAITKVSFAIRLDKGNENAPTQIQWFLIQKPENGGSWEVAMPVSKLSRD